MSHGQHNSAHSYRAPADRTRGTRLKSKLGRAISLRRLERLLKPQPPKEETDGGAQDHRNA